MDFHSKMTYPLSEKCTYLKKSHPRTLNVGSGRRKTFFKCDNHVYLSFSSRFFLKVFIPTGGRIISWPIGWFTTLVQPEISPDFSSSIKIVKIVNIIPAKYQHVSMLILASLHNLLLHLHTVMRHSLFNSISFSKTINHNNI